MNDREVVIVRDPSDKFGTFGVLKTDSGFSCYTAERNDLNNAPMVSCIPIGVYKCRLTMHDKHGVCYEVMDVPGRTAVLAHSGNFAGDPPLKSDTEGCVLIGNAIGEIAGQKALLRSKDATQRFMDDLDGSPFNLTILASAKSPDAP